MPPGTLCVLLINGWMRHSISGTNCHPVSDRITHSSTKVGDKVGSLASHSPLLMVLLVSYVVALLDLDIKVFIRYACVTTVLPIILACQLTIISNNTIAIMSNSTLLLDQ